MPTALLMLALAAAASAPPKTADSLCSTLFEGSLAAEDVRAAWISPALAAVSPTNVWVAWEAGSELQIRTRAKGSWTRVASPAKGEAWDPVLAIGAGGNPIAAWRANAGGGSRIFLARWDGKQWLGLGDGFKTLAPGEGSPLDASLRASREGVLHLAWRQQDGGLAVSRWTGTAWETVGEPLDSGGEAQTFDPFLFFDDANRPWATWVGGGASEPRLRVARWSGKKWERLHDQPAPAGAGLSSPRLESAGAAWLVLLWVEFADRSAPTESRLGVARWAGDRFDSMVAPAATPGGKGPQRLSVAGGRDDSLTLAWTELDQSRVSKVFAWQLKGGEWSPALTGLHADPHPANAQDAVLAAVPGGFLVLWDEPGGKLERLHVAHVSSCPARAASAEESKAAGAPGWPKTIDEAAERLLSHDGRDGRATAQEAQEGGPGQVPPRQGLGHPQRLRAVQGQREAARGLRWRRRGVLDEDRPARLGEAAAQARGRTLRGACGAFRAWPNVGPVC
ncbi:MAG TPA: hypothetical protein VGK67_00120 [Myxococcales bacterium]|jgi:hypothetical protein